MLKLWLSPGSPQWSQFPLSVHSDDGAADEPFRVEVRDKSLLSKSLQWVMEIGKNRDDEVQEQWCAGRVAIEPLADPAWEFRKASLREETTKWSIKAQMGSLSCGGVFGARREEDAL